MYRFFVDPQETGGEFISIVGPDYNHIRNVLRMSIGEEVLISDGQDREYLCAIDSFTNEEVIVKIVDVFGTSAELPVRLVLFQGMPKADKMELIVQKAVELGVHTIVPVNTKRTIVKYDSKKEAKKVERWNTIALSAAKQAKRGIIPEVTMPMSLKEAIAYADSLDGAMIPYEEAENMARTRQVISDIKGKESFGIFIGPEGGFEVGEIALAREHGIEPITLGKRILRTETAGLAVLSMIMYEIEED
jgi:16S rRNA (uracil1498-N3)-methyltransferase